MASRPAKSNVAAVLGTVLLAWGCSSESPDGTPPGRVEDLRVVAAAETTATVRWTAPGDDDERGTAASYDLRRSLDPLPASWETATLVEGVPVPREGGSAESLVVGNLENDRIYSLALRAADEAGNVSELSNVVQVQTGDPEPPGAITDLAAVDLQPRSVTLQLTAPGDDGSRGRATAYEMRRSETGITEATWPEALEVPVAEAPQEAGGVERIRVSGLEPHAVSFFAVRAWDDGGHLGALSNVLEVQLPGDTVPPSTIQDLEVIRVGYEQVRLGWTAPGDDGEEGRAQAYEVRWAEETISGATWGKAMDAWVPTPPQDAGGAEELLVHGLPQGATLWFAVRATDAVGNVSGVSNGAQASIPRRERTWRVAADGSGDAPSVQAAIDSAAHGDAVVVGPGTYEENIDLLGKRIHLRSLDGPEGTILKGSGALAPVVTCNSQETSETVVEGFTMTGGEGDSSTPVRSGGGVFCFHATATIRGNIIRGNRVVNPSMSSWGGGIYIGYPYPTDQPEPIIIEGNVIEDNFSNGNGGGIAIQAECLVRRNVIRNNQTGRGDGAGVYFNTSFRNNVHILLNEIVDNTAYDHGGGIYIGADMKGSRNIEVSWNVVVGNTALGEDAGARFRDCRGGGIWVIGHAWVHHNTVAFNRAETPFVRPDAGAICLEETDESTVVEYNIVYANEGGGVSTYGGIEEDVVILRRNLIYGNERDSISVDVNYRVIEEDNLFVDPLFCVDDETTRGELSESSPALTQPDGVIGAVESPGCGPKGVGGSTWARIRSRYEP